MLKWGNNFSWSYNGEVTDSMKDHVAKAGGDIGGVLRFSIQWNEDGKNNNDFDAHCREPNRNLINFHSKGRRHPSSGMLDVDIVSPNGKVAVENITWNNKLKMLEGPYDFVVHNYSSGPSKAGFTAEIEFDGQVRSFSYDKVLRAKEKVSVAILNFTKSSGIEYTKSLAHTQMQKEVWGVNTQQFHKVSMIMNSPNHWDGEETGNKHLFFMLEGCNNEGVTRGFYNEFLNGELTPHRKVFEMLSAKMRVAESDNQLSGLGFSSTKRDQVICKVNGSFARTVKINF